MIKFKIKAGEQVTVKDYVLVHTQVTPEPGGMVPENYPWAPSFNLTPEAAAQLTPGKKYMVTIEEIVDVVRVKK
jgi:hypothetical protein